MMCVLKGRRFTQNAAVRLLKISPFFHQSPSFIPLKRKKLNCSNNTHLNGLDIVGDDDQRSLLCLDKGGNVVDAELDRDGLGALLGLLAVLQ